MGSAIGVLRPEPPADPPEEETRDTKRTKAAPAHVFLGVPRTVNGTGHTGSSRFCATSP